MKIVRYLLLSATIVTLAACSKPESSSPEPAAEGPPVAEQMPAVEEVLVEVEVVEIEPGLTMRILKQGDGAVAEVGQEVFVHYTGWLYDPTAPDNRGAKFDSSLDRNEHFNFPLGGRRVISGWDRGVVGMKIGEKRELTIAPELAYGDRDLGTIPPGSTLVFEVDLAELRTADAAAEQT